MIYQQKNVFQKAKKIILCMLVYRMEMSVGVTPLLLHLVKHKMISAMFHVARILIRIVEVDGEI